MICYLLNKYNADKLVAFAGPGDTGGNWEMWKTWKPFNVTIETLTDPHPKGPLDPVFANEWGPADDAHWGEVVKQEKTIEKLNGGEKFTHTVPALSFVSFTFEWLK